MKHLASWVGKLSSVELFIKLSNWLIPDFRPSNWMILPDLMYNGGWIIWKIFQNIQSLLISTTVKVDARVSSDASGFGFFVVNLDKHIKLKSAPFSQLAKSSTWWELFGLHQFYTDESICVRFKGLTVRHYTDSLVQKSSLWILCLETFS